MAEERNNIATESKKVSNDSQHRRKPKNKHYSNIYSYDGLPEENRKNVDESKYLKNNKVSKFNSLKFKTVFFSLCNIITNSITIKNH